MAGHGCMVAHVRSPRVLENSMYIFPCKQKDNFANSYKICTIITVNGESFAGLNFRGFNPMKIFAVHWMGALVDSII